MDWSEKVIDIAGANFDILGCHNYEYEPENFEIGLRRIRDYLTKLRDYVRVSSLDHNATVISARCGHGFDRAAQPLSRDGRRDLVEQDAPIRDII